MKACKLLMVRMDFLNDLIFERSFPGWSIKNGIGSSVICIVLPTATTSMEAL
jgi:hypothetical protein